MVGQTLADLGEIHDGLDTGLLEVGGGTDARELEQVGGAEGTGGGNDIVGRDDGAVGQLHTGSLGSCASGVEDNLVDRGVEAYLDRLEGVEARSPLPLAIAPGLADIGAAQVLAGVLVKIGESLYAKVLPGGGGLLCQREDAVGGPGGRNVDGALLTVMLRVLIVEPVLGLLKVGELAPVAVTLVADNLCPLVKVNGSTTSPAAYMGQSFLLLGSETCMYEYHVYVLVYACIPQTGPRHLPELMAELPPNPLPELKVMERFMTPGMGSDW